MLLFMGFDRMYLQIAKVVLRYGKARSARRPRKGDISGFAERGWAS
jgi:hypothetical protein